MTQKFNLYDAIYKNGGFHGTGGDRQNLENLDIDFITEVKTIFNASNVNRPNANFTCEDELFLNQLTSLYERINTDFTNCAKTVEIEINNCLLKNSIIYYYTENSYRPFYVSLRENDINHSDFLPEIQKNNKKIKHINSDGRLYFYLETVGSANYGHWIIDNLAKVKAFLNSNLPITIVLQSYGKIDKLKIESIKYISNNKNIKFILIKKGEIFHFDKIKYITPLTYHPYIKNFHSIEFLNNLLLKRTKPQRNKVNLFVMRNKQHKRQITNLKQLIPILKKYNFKIIDPEAFCFKKQVEIFKNANLVVGTMCAAMCNTVFSPSKAKILYLSPNQWFEPFYWDLSANLNHEYNVLYGKRCNNSMEAHLDDFTIDEKKFETEIIRLTADL